MTEDNDRINGNKRNALSADAGTFHSGGEFYEIEVKGQLDSRWSEWLEGLEVNLCDKGEMTLYGPIVDQAALMGILNKLSRLNLTLLSVNKVNRKINKETK